MAASAASALALAVCALSTAQGYPAVSHPWKSRSDAASPFKSGAYTGPFQKITDNGLPVANVADGFGPEDKMVACNNKLIFIDLDYNGGTWFSFDMATWTPTNGSLQMSNSCPGIPLFPRSSGYTIGLTTAPGTSGDRIILVGGDANETNVYYSNNCGKTWLCNEDPELWQPRDYTVILPTTGVIPNDPVWLAGGRSFVSRNDNKDIFASIDGGATWSRPQCDDPSNCGSGCVLGGCRLQTPDPNGTCSSGNWSACYVLPDYPVYPGALATDWDTLWLFMDDRDDGNTWILNASLASTAWQLAPGRWGGFGRRIFIKGTVPGSGCWLSTDYLASELWIRPWDQANSMAGFATAPSGNGPWTDWTGKFLTPWNSRPRASAAVASTPLSTGAWFASGMTFVNGVAQNPTYADAYQIDAGVCLISPSNNQVCGGLVEPNLDGVYCSCPRAASGDPFCGSCTPNIAYGVWPACSLCPHSSTSLGGPPCGQSTGRGTCNAVAGCVCSPGFALPETGCNGCAAGFWGASCGACPLCGPNGACDGSGTTAGSGTCICNAGWTGNDCSKAEAKPAVPGGDIAAGVMGGLIGAALIGTLIYVRFFRGGPAVAQALRSVASCAENTGSGGKASETVSFIKAGAAPRGSTMTGEAATARLGSAYNTVGA